MQILALSLLISIIKLGDTNSVRERDTVNINCGTEKIRILSANYICRSDNRATDEKSRLALACDYKHSCSFTASNDVLGDPYPGCNKKFDYAYLCYFSGSIKSFGWVNIDCGARKVAIIYGWYNCYSRSGPENAPTYTKIWDATGNTLKTSNLKRTCNKHRCSMLVSSDYLGMDESDVCIDELWGYNRGFFDYGYTCVGGGDGSVWEWSTLNINCINLEIRIISANYICSSDNRATDFTSMLASNCDGKQSCSFTASNHVLGDPYHGCNKKFDYAYNCVPKGESSANKAEEINIEYTYTAFAIFIGNCIAFMACICCVYAYKRVKKGEKKTYGMVTEMDGSDIEDLINDK